MVLNEKPFAIKHLISPSTSANACREEKQVKKMETMKRIDLYMDVTPPSENELTIV
jgi:hypothetical protein